ncbi:phosphotransferase [Alteromonas sp. a30]|uniref:phosphotransferase n=1 Tax=Alteromonas sp. a30 TaxID=2730917 RepID=UPI002282B675|nr:phosphotransferase [Alteromonas sp. a30]MCY7296658.1 phosphotransferase [Alteromonas sp. a30]
MTESPSESLILRLHEFLQSLPWLPAGYQVELQVCESSNHTFKVTAGKERYFVKHFHATSFMPFDRVERFAVQKALANLAWAPRPLALSDDQLWQIEQFVEVECDTLNKAEQGNRQKDVVFKIKQKTKEQTEVSHFASIQKLAEVMALLHSSFTLTAEPSISTSISNSSLIPKEIKELALISHWHLYLSYIDKRKQDDYLDEIHALTPRWQSMEKTTLCHHDFALNHVVINPNQHMVFDWEYAAIGHPAFDVACAIMANNFSSQEAQFLVLAYVKSAHQQGYLINHSEKEIAEQVAAARPLVELTNRLWFDAYHQQLRQHLAC